MFTLIFYLLVCGFISAWRLFSVENVRKITNILHGLFDEKLFFLLSIPVVCNNTRYKSLLTIPFDVDQFWEHGVFRLKLYVIFLIFVNTWNFLVRSIGVLMYCQCSTQIPIQFLIVYTERSFSFFFLPARLLDREYVIQNKTMMFQKL